MKLFNAIQITFFYAMAPFGIAWIYTNDFPAASAAKWIVTPLYLAFCGFMVFCTYWGLDTIDRKSR